ncbi:unnamed protein product [Ectocarpus sp. CCAP 1310/34]|nr:unnamed protein product [Ectocarpus sp. CCAP 1310/34]
MGIGSWMELAAAGEVGVGKMQLVLYLIALGRVVEEIQRVPLPRRTSGCGGGNREKKTWSYAYLLQRRRHHVLRRKVHGGENKRGCFKKRCMVRSPAGIPHSLLEF